MSTEQLDWTGWEEQLDYEDWYRAERLWDNAVDRALIDNPITPTTIHTFSDRVVTECGDMRREWKEGLPPRYYIYRQPEPIGLVQQYITFTPIEQAYPHLKPHQDYLIISEWEAHPYQVYWNGMLFLVPNGGEPEDVLSIALMPLPKE